MPASPIVYKEVVRQDKKFYLIADGTLLLLLILTAVFALRGDRAAAVSCGLTTLFLVLLWQVIDKAVLLVTQEEFIIKFCLLTFRTPLADIESVEIKDVNLLREPYRGHITFWIRGMRLFNGLRVFRTRDGDAVHIHTRSGRTIIVTPNNNQELARWLLRGKENGR